MKFKSYICVFIGKINEVHILMNEKSNQEIPGFFKISQDTSNTKLLLSSTMGDVENPDLAQYLFYEGKLMQMFFFSEKMLTLYHWDTQRSLTNTILKGQVIFFSLFQLNQRTFRKCFNVASRDPVPDRKSIVIWVTTFRQTRNTTRRRTGVPRLYRSSENIEAVGASILQSPRRSARKHTSALGLYYLSVPRIFHDDLHCHPYKMAILQELSEREGRDPHLVFRYRSSKVFLSSSLRASHSMFHYLSSKVFLSFSLRCPHLMFHCLSQ